MCPKTQKEKSENMFQNENATSAYFQKSPIKNMFLLCRHFGLWMLWMASSTEETRPFPNSVWKQLLEAEGNF